MRHDIDVDIDPVSQQIIATMFIDTAVSPSNRLIDPRVIVPPATQQTYQQQLRDGLNPATPFTMIDAVQYLALLHSGTIPLAGTGWDAISKHPAHVGKTRLQAALDSISANKDTAAAAILGIAVAV